VNASRVRPCETILQKVDCSSCHAEVGQQYVASIHGQLAARKDANAPGCKECHGGHGVLGKQNPASPTFPASVPALCARCHREGQKAAVRYVGPQHQVVEHYTEHPRQGAAQERPHGDRHLHQLPAPAAEERQASA
jgi:hypothetical protein